ncbi:MAG: recombinase family protein [Actinobacteria bacterium]|nr:MAG: recombinase family protein [Actinomycetota bacterium]
MENKAVCYMRVSIEEQAREGVSLEAQTERLEAYCKAQGLQVVATIREEGVSASRPLASRPGGLQLLELVKRQGVTNVVALKLDRLFRDAVDALVKTQAWDKAWVSLHLVDMGGQALNTGSAMGRFFLGMMAGFAELERNLIAERTSAALTHKKNHREAYGPTPYGFDRKGDRLTENKEEQETLRVMRALREAGHSLRGIASKLNGESIPTKNGGAWHASTVSYILANSLHAG